MSPLFIAVVVIIGFFCAAAVARGLRMRIERLRSQRRGRTSSRR